jgi:hypothetical protein
MPAQSHISQLIRLVDFQISSFITAAINIINYSDLEPVANIEKEGNKISKFLQGKIRQYR